MKISLVKVNTREAYKYDRKEQSNNPIKNFDPKDDRLSVIFIAGFIHFHINTTPIIFYNSRVIE
jgi:hypothetical protein